MDYTALLTEILAKLDTIILYNQQIYVILMFVLIVAGGGWITYIMLRPLLYFLR